MISRLIVKNFYSVRDSVDMSLGVPAYAPEDELRFGETYIGSDVRVPKVISLWGPNASGKSTILRSLSFLAWFTTSSFSRQPEEPLPCQFFNTDENRRQPMEFSIEFSGPANLRDWATDRSQCPYYYSLALSGDGGPSPTRVLHEKLCYRPPGAKRRLTVFARDVSGLTRSTKAFGLAGFQKPLDKVLRPNVSMVSTLVQLGHEPSIAIRELARSVASNILIERTEWRDDLIAAFYLEHPDTLAELNKDIQRLDLGIEEVVVEKVSGLARATFVHSGLATPLETASESHGTRQFYKLFPQLWHVLGRGGLALVDELDSAIHPLILPEIISWFHDPERNPLGAQIWFTCQNVALLQTLNKEEIWFCEKDLSGGTTVFGLSDIKSVRRADNFMKKYLGGTYGAVPHIG